MKKNNLVLFLAGTTLCFGVNAHANTMTTVSPAVKLTPVTITPIKTVTPVPVTTTNQMPVDPLESPDDPLTKPEATNIIIPVRITTEMPPDDFGAPKVEIPNDSFGKTETIQRPPDPLEKQSVGIITPAVRQMPVEPLELSDDPLDSNAGLRLLNEITKGEQVEEPGKLKNSGPRVFDSFSEKDLANPEVVSLFVKDTREIIPAIKGVEIAENMVKVSYERKAKVFWLIPVKYNLTAEGNSDTGKVEMKKPWWLFLAKNDADVFQSALQDSTDDIGGMSEITSLRLQMNVERRAKIIQTLSNIISKISKTEEGLVSNIK